MPILRVQKVTPQTSLTLEGSCSSSCHSIALWWICHYSNRVAVCSGGGEEGHRCAAWRITPQCINEHSWAPKPLWHLQVSWEHSSFTQAQGFYPERDSDLREKKDACSLCTLAAPIFAGWLQVWSNMEQNTVFLIRKKKKKYTHGTASGGFLKLFKGKWKGWWLPLGEQLLYLQFTVSTGSLTREEDVVVAEAPEPQAT